jgi:Tfp pilus assembly pilus retraction ATPase PilT
MEYKKEIEQLVTTVVSEGASDLHLSDGRNPVVRVSGNLIPLVKSPVTTSADMKGYINEFLSEEKKNKLTRERHIDFSYSLTEVDFEETPISSRTSSASPSDSFRMISAPSPSSICRRFSRLLPEDRRDFSSALVR